MGDLIAMLLSLDISSAALGTLIWIGVIAIVMICVFIVGIVGLSASNNKTKT
jgi:hypothetical protein